MILNNTLYQHFLTHSLRLSVQPSIRPSICLWIHPFRRVIFPSFYQPFCPSFPLGFPQTLSCTLFNTSLVPLTYALRVPGDGAGPPSGTSSQQVTQLTRVHWRSAAALDPHARPTEFSLRPAAGTIRAMSDVFVEVTWSQHTCCVTRFELVWCRGLTLM